MLGVVSGAGGSAEMMFGSGSCVGSEDMACVGSIISNDVLVVGSSLLSSSLKEDIVVDTVVALACLGTLARSVQPVRNNNASKMAEKCRFIVYLFSSYLSICTNTITHYTLLSMVILHKTTPK